MNQRAATQWANDQAIRGPGLVGPMHHCGGWGHLHHGSCSLRDIAIAFLWPPRPPWTLPSQDLLLLPHRLSLSFTNIRLESASFVWRIFALTLLPYIVRCRRQVGNRRPRSYSDGPRRQYQQRPDPRRNRQVRFSYRSHHEYRWPGVYYRRIGQGRPN
jgi:hypothetical protein